MRCLKLELLVMFLFPLFFILSTLFDPSNAASQSQDHLIHYFRDASTPDFLEVNTQNHGIIKPITRRNAAETAQNSTYLILAADRTHRRDPSDNFNFYKGGWNITNPHYLFSVAFSAVGPLIVAILWFLVFGICLFCFCICCCCCCRRKTYGYSKTAYALSIFCLTLFTLAAIGGYISINVGQEKFQNSVVDVISLILHKADVVIVNLIDLLNNFISARNSSVGQTLLPQALKEIIDNIHQTINKVMAQFRDVTEMDKQEIRIFLSPLRLTLIAFSTALLILAFLGYLCSILGLQCVVYCLVLIGWILVAVTFVLSGTFLLMHNVVADTCFAVGEWLQNPDARSALETIIPKVDNKTAQEISSATKGVILGLITMVNVQIANVSNVDMPTNAGPLYYNQSGPPVPVLCSPYSSDLADRHCAIGEVSFKNASQVWRNYVCETSGSGKCATRGRITPDGYNQMMTAVNVSDALYTEIPFVVNLIDSTYLKQVFGGIHKDYCPNLERYTKWMYVGFLTCSAAVTLSLIFWIIYSRERRHRKYTKKIDARHSAGLGYSQYP